MRALATVTAPGSISLTLTNRGFSGGYHEYFGPNVDEEGVVYLMLVRIYIYIYLPRMIE